MNGDCRTGAVLSRTHYLPGRCCAEAPATQHSYKKDTGRRKTARAVTQKQHHTLRIPHTKTSTPKATSVVQKQHQQMKENHAYISKPRAQNTTDENLYTKGNIRGTNTAAKDERQLHIYFKTKAAPIMARRAKSKEAKTNKINKTRII